MDKRLADCHALWSCLLEVFFQMSARYIGLSQFSQEEFGFNSLKKSPMWFKSWKQNSPHVMTAHLMGYSFFNVCEWAKLMRMGSGEAFKNTAVFTA